MSFDPTDKIAPFPPRATEMEPGFTRFEPLIDPARLKSDYLFGIPLKSALTGQEMTDATLSNFIVRAISAIEHDVQINISPVKYVDRYDYNLWDYQKYNFIQLNHWPVLRIESVKGKYPNAVDFIQYPQEWVALYNETGTFQLTPTNGQITQFFLTNDATYLPLILGSRAQWPQLWQVTYEAGLDRDKIPAAVNDLIATRAALDALSVLGPILFPYASYGIGIDGVSQSVGTLGPQMFQQRVTELTQKYEELRQVVKRFYNKAFLLTAI